MSAKRTERTAWRPVISYIGDFPAGAARLSAGSGRRHYKKEKPTAKITPPQVSPCRGHFYGETPLQRCQLAHSTGCPYRDPFPGRLLRGPGPPVGFLVFLPVKAPKHRVPAGVHPLQLRVRRAQGLLQFLRGMGRQQKDKIVIDRFIFVAPPRRDWASSSRRLSCSIACTGISSPNRSRIKPVTSWIKAARSLLVSSTALPLFCSVTILV